MKASSRLLDQPATGVITATAAGLVLALSWLTLASTAWDGGAARNLILASFLAGAVVLAYLFPIQVRHETKVSMSSVPLFLLVALLPVPLGVTAVAAAKLAGELAVQRRAGTFPSDIAVQIGRWVVAGWVGSLFLHLPGQPPHLGAVERLHPAVLRLLLTAGWLWLAEILSAPLLLTPATGEPPHRIVAMVVREAGMVEGAEYLVGVLGALASLETPWAAPLLCLPTALTYLSFKTAKDMHEKTRHLLASVVEVAPDAVLLLDLAGRVITANRQAAVLYGCGEGEDLTGTNLADRFHPDHRERAVRDMETCLRAGSLKATEYTALKRDGAAFPAELSWSVVADKRGQARAITGIVRDITERTRAAEALRHQAMHDPLTDLPNRAMLQERLEALITRAQQRGTSFALFLMDLDRFKQVNDTYGHQDGDELLRQVAGRLRRAVRDSDTIARLGGDEFAALLPGAELAGAEMVASRIESAIAEPFEVGDRRLEVGVSIGVALYPADGEDLATLLHQADLAMYRAKRGRRGSSLVEPALAAEN